MNVKFEPRCICHPSHKGKGDCPNCGAPAEDSLLFEIALMPILIPLAMLVVGFITFLVFKQGQ